MGESRGGPCKTNYDYFLPEPIYVLHCWSSSPAVKSPSAPLITETDGSYVRIPDSSTKVIVWGDKSEAIKTFKSWLLKRRIVLIDEARIRQIATEMGLHNALSNADVLKAAKWLEPSKSFSSMPTCPQLRVVSTYLGQRHRNASIHTRALNVDSAEIDWNGKARSPEPFTVH
jgi:hypothetical protein